jgi:hypothetical protein
MNGSLTRSVRHSTPTVSMDMAIRNVLENLRHAIRVVQPGQCKLSQLHWVRLASTTVYSRYNAQIPFNNCHGDRLKAWRGEDAETPGEERDNAVESPACDASRVFAGALLVRPKANMSEVSCRMLTYEASS